MPEIDIIRIPRPVIDNIPPPVTSGIEPPVVTGIGPPVVDLPTPTIDYPIIDVPTEQDFRDDLSVPQEVEQEEEGTDSRELPPAEAPNPTIDVGGIEVPLPKPEVAVTAGTSAVVATTVSLFAAMAFQQVKTALAPVAKEMMRPKSKKGKKAKIKQKKPVLHFVEDEKGVVEIFQYSEKGVKVLGHVEGKLETYLRDQIEINPYYEMENKIIVDDVLKEQFTKEGAKRFKSLFTPAKVILKKLSAKFSV